MIKLNNNHYKTLWITRTAIFAALLIIVQFITAPMGNQFITGSCVNFILIASVMTCGMASGVTVAVISPILAKLVGIGPLWILIPFVALGNVALCLVWHYVNKKEGLDQKAGYVISIIAGALLKFVVLFIGIGCIAVPVILKLPDPQAKLITTMFSWPQLITALIGGIIAFFVVPPLKRSLDMQHNN